MAHEDHAVRLKHLLIAAVAAGGMLALGAPARAEPGSMLVPLDQGFG
jgi:hypothetical protein